MPAGNDASRGLYSGMHGLLLVEPRSDPGRYDQEAFVVLHDLGGQFLASDDGSMNPSYDTSTINGHVMGYGEPLRVRSGQRMLLHILNASPTEVHWIAFAGHAMQVISLDGNRVPHPKTVAMLRLAPAERASVIVELNNPGVWILGEVRKHVQAAGMAIAVEYAGSAGKPQWQQPQQLIWDYSQFADTDTSASSAGRNGDSARLYLRNSPAMARWTTGPSMASRSPIPIAPRSPRGGAIVLSSVTTAKTIIPCTCIVTASRWCASPAVRVFAD